MTTGRKTKAALKGRFSPAKARRRLSVGQSVRIARELNELSQNELAGLTGIAQSTISAIETDRVKLGAERSKMLARALKVHPAVLLFPGWRTEDESAA
ncbi:MAG: helix-turn-helix transcriptional regulator [Polyangiales bacterium]